MKSIQAQLVKPYLSGSFSKFCLYVPSVINIPTYLLEQLASLTEFQTLNIYFPTFWFFPILCVISLLSLWRQKATRFWVALWKDKRVSAACSLFHPGSITDFRCLGKPSVALEAVNLGWEPCVFWLLCFQLERPLRKPISQHFLQNCLYPSHLVFSSDVEPLERPRY